MSDFKISDLTAAVSLAGADQFEIDTGTVSRKVTGTQIQTFVLNGVTLTELSYLGGVTSALQTQLNGKSNTSHTHLLSAITDVTATVTEVNRLSGVTSAVQTQLDSKPPNTRTISTTAPLTGGGDLSANRTLALDITGSTTTTVATGDEVLIYDISIPGIRKTTAGDIAALGGGGGGVPTSRLVATSTGLQGGGDLSADRTLSVTTNQRVYLTQVSSSATGSVTLSATQENSFVYCTNASTVTFTIPPNSSEPFATGTEIEFWRSDASVVITEGSGVTLNGHDGTGAVTTTATIGTQHTGCCIKKVATDTWVVFGRFIAS